MRAISTQARCRLRWATTPRNSVVCERHGFAIELGLATPVAAIYHDATNSESEFVSLLHNHAEGSVAGECAIATRLLPGATRSSQNDYECSSDYYMSVLGFSFERISDAGNI